MLPSGALLPLVRSYAVQEEIEGYLKPMKSQDWDKGSLLSMRTMNFASSFPYESVSVPVRILIGEQDTFLLKTATRVCFPALPACCMANSEPQHRCLCFRYSAAALSFVLHFSDRYDDRNQCSKALSKRFLPCFAALDVFNVC